MKFYPLGFTCPGFLGGLSPTVFEPDTADPDLYAWYSADDYVTCSDDSTIYVVGNKADRQVDKDERSASGTTNVIPVAAGYEPLISYPSNAGNLCRYNSDLNAANWVASNVTKNSATTMTFTAQNGNVLMQVPAYYHEPGANYVLSAKIRRISGNTALQLGHNSNWQNITITDSVATYSWTVSAVSISSAVSIGIRDPNAAGHGQIEIYDWSFRKETWDNTIVSTTNVVRPASTSTGTCLRTFIFQSRGQLWTSNEGSDTFGGTFTIYMTYRPSPWISPGRIFSHGTEIYDLFFSNESVSKGLRLYTTGSPAKLIETATNFVTDYAWHVITIQVNAGGTSYLRKNLDAALSASLNSVGNDGIYTWGGNQADGFSAQFQTTDLIIREVSDDAATQELYVRYLAERCGLTL